MKDPVYFKAFNASTGQILATRVKIADDPRSRSVGLLNRQSLEPDEALPIKPCSSIHTFFMKFPIDACFLDKSGKVMKIYEGLKPWRLAGVIFGGCMVLETVSGLNRKVGIKTGDIIKFQMSI